MLRYVSMFFFGLCFSFISYADEPCANHPAAKLALQKNTELSRQLHEALRKANGPSEVQEISDKLAGLVYANANIIEACDEVNNSSSVQDCKTQLPKEK